MDQKHLNSVTSKSQSITINNKDYKFGNYEISLIKLQIENLEFRLKHVEEQIDLLIKNNDKLTMNELKENDNKIRCKICNEEMLVNASIVLTSYPPMYGLMCPKCGNYITAYCDKCSNNKKIYGFNEWNNIVNEVNKNG